jgi:hypothetical protein
LTKSRIGGLSQDRVEFVSDGKEKEVNFDVLVVAFGGRPSTFEPLEVPTCGIRDAAKVSKIPEAARNRCAVGPNL